MPSVRVFCHSCNCEAAGQQDAQDGTLSCSLCNSTFVEERVETRREAARPPRTTQAALPQFSIASFSVEIGPETISNMLQIPGMFQAGAGLNPADFASDATLDSILSNLLRQHQPSETPTPPDIISALPRVPAESAGCKGEPCAVCHDVFEGPNQVVKLPCSHCYHESCITPWLSSHNTCPVCRLKLSPDQPSQSANQQRGTQAPPFRSFFPPPAPAPAPASAPAPSRTRVRRPANPNPRRHRAARDDDDADSLPPLVSDSDLSESVYYTDEWTEEEEGNDGPPPRAYDSSSDGGPPPFDEEDSDEDDEEEGEEQEQQQDSDEEPARRVRSRFNPVTPAPAPRAPASMPPTTLLVAVDVALPPPAFTLQAAPPSLPFSFSSTTSEASRVLQGHSQGRSRGGAHPHPHPSLSFPLGLFVDPLAVEQTPSGGGGGGMIAAEDGLSSASPSSLRRQVRGSRGRLGGRGGGRVSQTLVSPSTISNLLGRVIHREEEEEENEAAVVEEKKFKVQAPPMTHHHQPALNPSAPNSALALDPETKEKNLAGKTPSDAPEEGQGKEKRGFIHQAAKFLALSAYGLAGIGLGIGVGFVINASFRRGNASNAKGRV